MLLGIFSVYRALKASWTWKWRVSASGPDGRSNWTWRRKILPVQMSTRRTYVWCQYRCQCVDVYRNIAEILFPIALQFPQQIHHFVSSRLSSFCPCCVCVGVLYLLYPIPLGEGTAIFQSCVPCHISNILPCYFAMRSIWNRYSLKSIHVDAPRVFTQSSNICLSRDTFICWANSRLFIHAIRTRSMAKKIAMHSPASHLSHCPSRSSVNQPKIDSIAATCRKISTAVIQGSIYSGIICQRCLRLVSKNMEEYRSWANDM